MAENKNKERFIILDGSSLLYRAFYGIQQLLTAPTGEYTNAIYGFSNMLIHLLEEWKPDYLVIAFDKGKHTFRHDVYNDYKGTRKPTPPELKQQIPLLHEMAEAWGISFQELADYEADDIIGTLSKKAVENGCEAYIVTGDRDALQLIGPDRKVLYTKRGTSDLQVWDEKLFADEYGGLEPIQLVDLKGLMGDSSDNIPGIPGVGPKTAIKLIAAYGTVEEVLLHGQELSGKKLKEGVANFGEQALMSKKLARICQEVPVEYNSDEFKIKTEREKLLGFYNKYAMRSIMQAAGKYLNNIGVEAVEEVKEKFAVPNYQPWSDEISNSSEIWIKFLNEGKVPHVKPMAAAVFDGKGYYYVTADDFSWFSLEDVLQNGKIKKNIHNLKAAYHAGMSIKGEIIDLELVGYLLDPSTGKYGVADLVSRYVKEDVGAEEYLEKKPAGKKKIDAAELALKNEQELKWQGAMLVKLSAVMLNKLQEFKLEKLYWDMELPLIEVLASMEQNGIAINKERLAEQAENIGRGVAILEQEIYTLAAQEFNINSPKQLGEILFEKLQLPAAKKTKTGYSTSAEVLEELVEAHPIIEKILSYRTLSKLKTTYLDSLGELADKETGRIHTSFNQTVTATGRLSSSDPNLQNIPVRTDIGRQIRAVFEPGKGYDAILSADYSQIELRVLASMSGDEAFIKAFKAGEDIHARTAAEVFNVPIDDITPRMRRNAKAVNFGIVYGISDFGLAKDLKITRKEAAGFIESYFQKCPGIKSFLDNTVANAKEAGLVETMYGRRRELPGLKSSNFNLRSLAERMAMNTPIQGTAADIIKIAMIRAYKMLKDAELKSRILLQVHDELVLEVVESEIPKVKEILTEAMENAAKLSVPLSIDINEGKNWAEAK